MRTLTGIQPSGSLHIGNYFGAIKPALAAQSEGDCFFVIVDYHSMTSLTDGPRRRANTREAALDWLACGIDLERSVFWKQSAVPEVCELTWILGTLAPMGLLERAHSYKDKVARGISPHFGLFAYPVLMAADILAFDAERVPVGKDQKQHVEMTRDLAAKFNQTYGQTFVIPEYESRYGVATVPGLDGQKMSKSYGNTLEIFGEEKLMRQKIMSIVMDSRTREEPKPDADQNTAIQLFRLVAPEAVAADYEARLRAGGLGYGDLKKALFEHYWEFFAPFRKKRAELAADPAYVDHVLAEGAARAREVASSVMKRVRNATGLD
ncbi:tryptophan--tRNA ligase [Cephaloticoccus capnophilus]|uniref:Tryptophan--tRNA ligase n=1 Tax=Cephaloticoccus capnophilus TaxID=1548208 RepID=A0A139SNH4_9BACT|nr:tryptophan--tRNA ligase [Cephaloticoccus capnophilus]KXU36106.1 tryptophan--tRNA ligase [Cephaloticoccus capnophilus]